MMPAPSSDLRWRAIFPEGQMLFEILYAGQMRILLPLFIELLISILSLITIYCGSIWLNAMFTSLHLKLFRSHEGRLSRAVNNTTKTYPLVSSSKDLFLLKLNKPNAD